MAFTNVDRESIERARVARTAAEWKALPVVECDCSQKFYREHVDQVVCRDCMHEGEPNSFYAAERGTE